MRLEMILEKIDKIIPPNKQIQILAVTKNRTIQEIKSVIQQGVSLIGENRVQEAESKLSTLFAEGVSVEKHLIGSLQSNKENKALELFDVIQSIESLEQLTRIIKKLESRNISKRLYFQYNTSGESSKHGLCSEKELYKMIDLVCEHPLVTLEGLMTIGAMSSEEKLVRESFYKLSCIKDRIIVQYPNKFHLKLSMGMSNDFEWAIQEGADLIRLGTILFI